MFTIKIRKHKTDDIDSVLIVDLIRYGDFLETRLSDEAVQSLRTLSRFRSYLVDSIADLKLPFRVKWHLNIKKLLTNGTD